MPDGFVDQVLAAAEADLEADLRNRRPEKILQPAGRRQVEVEAIAAEPGFQGCRLKRTNRLAAAAAEKSLGRAAASAPAVTRPALRRRRPAAAP